MKTPLLLTAVISLAAPSPLSSQLVINEIMQSNIDCIMDDINEFPDSWVELYNPGNAPVNLSDYSLGDKPEAGKAYRLPYRMIKPGGYVVIYCDKEGKDLHTSFRLDSGKGGAVYLFKKEDIADRIENWKKQPAPNIAYGRATDGADAWGYQATPTPGGANCGKICKDVLSDPVFSAEGHVATDPFVLNISLPDGAPAGSVIRYTDDGTEPTEMSREAKASLYISSTRTIRAKLFCDEYLSPRSVTHSYIFHPRAHTLPIVSMVTDGKYFYDDKIGIYVEGANKNYEYDWRRPVNIELFEPDGKSGVINQLCETRVKGGASRGNALKSLVVYANKRFGTKRFSHELFPDDAPGLDDWKSFELRNAGNDFDYLYMRDAAIQRIMGSHCDIDWQPYRPAIFYLNGKYMGMLNIRSRTNEDHIYTFYKGEEDIDMFENWGELKEGTWDNYNAFKEFYNGHGHSMAEYSEWMDVEEFANIMIMNLFYDNRDFPGNNIVMWRPRTEGGRWRWIAKDTDFGLGLYGHEYNYKTFNWINDNNYDSGCNWANTWEATRLFRRLMEDGDFFKLFTDRCAIYMGDFMNERGTVAVLDDMYRAIADEYPHHRKLFNEYWPNYSTELKNAKDWIKNRTPYFYNHLAEYYKLGTPRPVSIDASRRDDLKITVNGVQLCNRDFIGQYFQGQTLTVSAEVVSNLNVAVTSWRIRETRGTSVTTMIREGSVLRYTVPDCSSVSIESVMGMSGIENISGDDQKEFDHHSPLEVYSVSGVSLGTFGSTDALREHANPGVYILRQGATVVKYVLKK